MHCFKKMDPPSPVGLIKLNNRLSIAATRAVAVYGFQASNADELTFKVGCNLVYSSTLT